MQLPTIKAVLPNKAPDKKGELPIMIRVTFQRKLYHKATGYKVKPAFFTEHGLMKNDVSNAAYKNRAIKDKIAEIEREFIKEYEKNNLSKYTISNILNGKRGSGISFSIIANATIDKYEWSLAKRTIEQLRLEASKIEKYKPGVTVQDITPALMKDYELWMRNTKKNNHNTVGKTYKEIKSILSKAFSLGLISENIADTLSTPKYIQPKRNHLSEDEIEKFEEYADNGAVEYLRMIAAWFVFQIRVGVRYSDLIGWDESKSIKDGKLVIVDEKTKTPHYVPIYPKLQKSIDRVKGLRSIPTNQICNRALKEIAKQIGVITPINTHVARHTFAVTYLNNNGSIEVLSKLMGHASTKTTAIYGQITDKRINDEALKVFGN